MERSVAYPRDQLLIMRQSPSPKRQALARLDDLPPAEIAQQREMPAGTAIALEPAFGRQSIAHSLACAVPDDVATVFHEFERMTEAGAVVVVHLVTDLVTDDRADRRARQNCNQAVVIVADRSADRAADDGAEHCAHAIAVAPASANAIVVRPLVAGVADIVGVVLLAPSVRRRMGWRVGKGGQWSGGGDQQRRCRGGEQFM